MDCNLKFFHLMVSCFYPRLRLLALTYCDVGYWMEEARRGGMFADRRRLTCLLSTVKYVFFIGGIERYTSNASTGSTVSLPASVQHQLCLFIDSIIWL